MANWKAFCSAYANSTDSAGNLRIWLPEVQDFSECFHDVFQAAAHAALLVGTVVFLAPQAAPRRLRDNVLSRDSQRKHWLLRVAAAFLILGTVVVRQIILLANAPLREKLGMVGVVAD